MVVPHGRQDLRRHLVGFVLPLLVAASGLTACGAIGRPASEACMPPEFIVSPSHASAGQSVQISAPAATCSPRYGHDAQVEITIQDAEDRHILHELAPMSDDGAFQFAFAVPQDIAPGEASIMVFPHGLDWCDDTGSNNRLSAGEPAMLRASCAVPTRVLIIEPS